MAQRITRAKRTVSGVRLDQPGDVTTVLRVLYLIFNEGYSGDVDLAAEAIRLARQLAGAGAARGGGGLLALLLLHHARRPTRTGPDGRLVPLAEQDRRRWDTRLITEGVEVLQAALARDRLGEFQAQAAIAALHADARTAEETDWVQVVEWYDELVRLTGSPVALLNRAVAVGEADEGRGPDWPPYASLDPGLPRYTAVSGAPAREGRRPRHRGAALRRGGPVGAEPARARPPDPAGRAPQRPELRGVERSGPPPRTFLVYAAARDRGTLLSVPSARGGCARRSASLKDGRISPGGSSWNRVRTQTPCGAGSPARRATRACR